MKIKQVAFVALLCAVCAMPIALVGRQARTSIANGTSLPTTCALGDLFYLTTSNGTGALNVCLTPSIWAPLNMLGTTTFYVCAKGAGGTCVYNGDGGTVATPSDANTCLTKALPCATFAGVAALVNGKYLTGIVTIQLADTAGTGTDCYQPNGVIFDPPNAGGATPFFSVYGAAAGPITDVYPSTYLYLQGNTTTKTNVSVIGATTCTGTTSSAQTAVYFKGIKARIRGMQLNYFKLGTVECVSSCTLYAEDLNVTSDSPTPGGNVSAVEAYYNSTLLLGGTINVTNDTAFRLNFGSMGVPSTPLGHLTTTISEANNGYMGFHANQFSQWQIQGVTATFAGAGTYTAFMAQAFSDILMNATTAAPTALTFNAAAATEALAANGSQIDEGCGTFQFTCTFTALGKRGVAQDGSNVFTSGASSADSASTSDGNACVFAAGAFPVNNPIACNLRANQYEIGSLSGMAVANVGANSCGTTAATIDGGINSGVVTVGATAGTQCRITFAIASPSVYDCTATDQTATIATRVTPVDSTHVDLFGAFGAGDKVTYVCFARR